MVYAMGHAIQGCQRRLGACLGAALLLCGLGTAVPAAAADPGSGNRIYFARCVGCHGVGGKSINPEAPSLAGSDKVLQPDVMLLTRIKTGRNRCPPFLGILSDKEILDLVSYMRTLH